MYRSTDSSPAPARSRALPLAFAGVTALILWFGLSAIATPFDHDESQYVAGAYFSSRLLIFRDFLSLQPPVHSWAFAPLAWLFPAHMVLAMRLATAATALATLAMLYAAQRIAGIARGSAIIATLAVAATATFQFTGAVVRNDMLPTLLAAMAMSVTLMALRRRARPYWFWAGLLFGLAIATKLNFAPLGLAAGLFVLYERERSGLTAAAWMALGGVAGMAPMLLIWAVAPEAFTYGVLRFGAGAPHAWYALNGAAHELTVAEKGADLLRFLSKGPALAALLLLAGNGLMMRGRARSPGRRRAMRLAIWMIAGALIGAALPTPAQLQYLMPLLPPLALALGGLLDDARAWSVPGRRALLGLLCVAALPGMWPTGRYIAAMTRGGSPVLAAGEAARRAGAAVRAHDDIVATLSPHMILDSGLTLDRRFATGPFAYRTGWMLSDAQARRIHAMTAATLTDLDRSPPAAILVGYEAGTRKLPLRPDDGLIAYARQRGYRPVAMPDGIGRLYLRMRPAIRTPAQRRGR